MSLHISIFPQVIRALKLNRQILLNIPRNGSVAIHIHVAGVQQEIPSWCENLSFKYELNWIKFHECGARGSQTLLCYFNFRKKRSSFIDFEVSLAEQWRVIQRFSSLFVTFDTYLHLLQFKLLKCIQFIDSHSKNLWTICIFISCLKSLFDHYVNCTNWRIKNGKLWMTCQVKTPLSSQKTDDYFNFSFEGGFCLDCSTSGLGSDEPSVVTRVDTKCHSIQWHFKFFCSFSY